MCAEVLAEVLEADRTNSSMPIAATTTAATHAPPIANVCVSAVRPVALRGSVAGVVRLRPDISSASHSTVSPIYR